MAYNIVTMLISTSLPVLFYVFAFKNLNQKKADLIIVLDKGRIAETGTHQALLDKDGLYAHLCALQSFS